MGWLIALQPRPFSLLLLCAFFIGGLGLQRAEYIKMYFKNSKFCTLAYFPPLVIVSIGQQMVLYQFLKQATNSDSIAYFYGHKTLLNFQHRCVYA